MFVILSDKQSRNVSGRAQKKTEKVNTFSAHINAKYLH